MKEKCYVFGHTFEENPKREYYKYSCTQCGRKSDYPVEEKFEHTFWDSFEWRITKFILIGLSIVYASVLIIVYIGNSMALKSCMKYQELGINTMHSFWTGCMAKHPVYGWVPVEKYFEILNVIVK